MRVLWCEPKHKCSHVILVSLLQFISACSEFRIRHASIDWIQHGQRMEVVLPNCFLEARTSKKILSCQNCLLETQSDTWQQGNSLKKENSDMIDDTFNKRLASKLTPSVLCPCWGQMNAEDKWMSPCFLLCFLVYHFSYYFWIARTQLSVWRPLQTFWCL